MYQNEHYKKYYLLQKEFLNELIDLKDKVADMEPGDRRSGAAHLCNTMQRFNDVSVTIVEAQQTIIEAQLKYMDEMRQSLMNETKAKEQSEYFANIYLNKLRTYEPQF